MTWFRLGVAFAMAMVAFASANATELSERIAQKHRIVGSGDWYGCVRTVFDFEGYEAWVVEPPAGTKVAEGHPWTWTMQWAKAFVPRTSVPRLVRDFGWRHATIITFKDKMNAHGLEVSRRFHRYLSDELGFATKVNLIGMSWGGFFSVRYAATYPDVVRKIYLDCPLLFLRKRGGDPSGFGPWEKETPIGGDWSKDPRMPINLCDRVAKAKIPVLLLYGGADTIVDPDAHARPFVEKFKAAGGDIRVIERRMYGHHPHGVELNENTIVDFFRESNEAVAKPRSARDSRARPVQHCARESRALRSLAKGFATESNE